MSGVETVEGVFRREFPRLVRSLSVAFGVEEAADAVQEAFIAADRHWDRVAGYDDPAGWIRRVALNRLLNERRTRRRRAAVLDSLRAPEQRDLTAESLDLAAAIGRLPTQQRLAVCLHYLGGYSVQEVADAMQIAVGTVKSHLHAARGTLRITLTEVES